MLDILSSIQNISEKYFKLQTAIDFSHLLYSLKMLTNYITAYVWYFHTSYTQAVMGVCQ